MLPVVSPTSVLQFCSAPAIIPRSLVSRILMDLIPWWLVFSDCKLIFVDFPLGTGLMIRLYKRPSDLLLRVFSWSRKGEWSWVPHMLRSCAFFHPRPRRATRFIPSRHNVSCSPVADGRGSSKSRLYARGSVPGAQPPVG